MVRKYGFTLIELLIVVAIIAILAAIAVPNFLEAQTRAKVSRVKSDMRSVDTAFNSYYVDYGTLPPDRNDGTVETNPYKDLLFAVEQGYNPFNDPDIQFRNDDGALPNFHLYSPYALLTTPVSYISSIITDTFMPKLPFAYDTRLSTDGNNNLWYVVMSSAGPDNVAGDWFRFVSPTGMAIPYDPTNGTVSRGDIWRSPVKPEPTRFFQEYPFDVK